MTANTPLNDKEGRTSSSTSVINIQDSSNNEWHGELEKGAVSDPADGDFEKVQIKRSKYGLIEKKRWWPNSSHLILCLLILVVGAFVVLKMRQLLQKGGFTENIGINEKLIFRRLSVRSADSHIHRSPDLDQQTWVDRTLMEARGAENRKLEPEINAKSARNINERQVKINEESQAGVEENMDPKTISTWINEEMIKPNSESLLKDQEKTSLAKVPQLMATPPNIDTAYLSKPIGEWEHPNPVTAPSQPSGQTLNGRGSYQLPEAINGRNLPRQNPYYTAREFRADVQMGVAPRLRVKELEDLRDHRHQLTDNWSEYDTIPRGQGRATTQALGRANTPRHNRNHSFQREFYYARQPRGGRGHNRHHSHPGRHKHRGHHRGNHDHRGNYDHRGRHNYRDSYPQRHGSHRGKQPRYSNDDY